jgi:glucose-1-phosphate thymidylyltransferase
MKAIIPVAGEGRRLQPLTDAQPKALLQVANRPVLGHILARVENADVTDVVLVVGERSAPIEEYVRSEFPRVRLTLVLQEEPLGLGHAVWLTREVAAEDELLIIYGDTIVEADLAQALNTDADGAIGVREVDDPRRFGVVVEEAGRITRLVEKPDEPVSHLAIVGVNCIRDSAALFDALGFIVSESIRTRGEIQLTDAFQRMLNAGKRLVSFPIDEWHDCGTPKALLETNRHLLDKLLHEPQGEGCQFSPPVYIAPTATVKDSQVGPHVAIAAGAQVRNCALKDCIVNQNAQLTDCKLDSRIVAQGDELHNLPRLHPPML